MMTSKTWILLLALIATVVATEVDFGSQLTVTDDLTNLLEDDGEPSPDEQLDNLHPGHIRGPARLKKTPKKTPPKEDADPAETYTLTCGDKTQTFHIESKI